MWDKCGMARDKSSLTTAIGELGSLREEFWQNVSVPGSDADLNQALEKANRVADFIELGELMCHDALEREESCGGHFRTEHQTPDGEALRNDAEYAHVAAWQYQGENAAPTRLVEPLTFENVLLSQRSYK
jgi:succinate dehydrogenase / fumarate reductase flavoprotein subunit